MEHDRHELVQTDISEDMLHTMVSKSIMLERNKCIRTFN